MAGQTGPRGFRPGPQGQYQNQPPPIGMGTPPVQATGGVAGGLGGGGRLGLGSNIGAPDPMAGRSMGGFGGPVAPPSGAGSNPQGGAGMGRTTPPFGGVAGGSSNMMADATAGASYAVNPDTTTATHIPQEPGAEFQQQDVVGGYGTGGPLTKLPTGGYGGTGPGGKPMTFGKVMPGSGGAGPLRRG